MSARDLIQSPVLVGRGSQLALMERRLAEAAAGGGQLVFVAGEAGIGKTRLLSSVTRRARGSGFAVIRAAAFPGDAQSFAGLLVDLAGGLVITLGRRPTPASSLLSACRATRCGTRVRSRPSRPG